MSIDQFTKDQFEEALPKGKWLSLGLIDGEYVYEVPVYHKTHGHLVSLYIRSSLGVSGVADACGKDSIRVLIVDTFDHKPVASKTCKYVTRVKGWSDRLTKVLRDAYKLALFIVPCPKGCNRGAPLHLYRQKSGPRVWFLRCSKCQSVWFSKPEDPINSILEN